ncbi:SprA family protein [Roseibium hamelinense]|uniref:SprA family protein n=1 Tax=Roseibium hamelinense TaxID=150831 RepID=A0A562SLX6_9HYPH|nr:putative metalloprotease CJM1_0395 family protein [Roseibium hamelinense]MTI45090.1 hypothetical protein [Roseibium hamelinense]TWI82357.1 SprA family protein [Roseibium hamelinense]
MISALLSNTPVSGLRGSGLAGDTRTLADEPLLERGRQTARESEVSAQSLARATGRVGTLSPQAVVALQESGEASTGGSRRSEQTDGSTTQPQSKRPAVSSGNTQQTASLAVEGDQGAAGEAVDTSPDDLTPEEEKQVRELQQRDREVRAHEQAHARVGGQYAGAPSYTFQQGPDGKRYAIGGEVQIDTSPERTPDATIRKMQIVIRAALAPAEPSSQDMRVAQQARAQLSEAQAERRQAAAEELQIDNAEGAENAGDAASDFAAYGTSFIDGGDLERGEQDRQRSQAIAAYSEALSRVVIVEQGLFSGQQSY